ncbi:SMI1/KNR4 family protein [Actinopolymorpha alba]|uniref:SMI1/KNR4 family protein n=1 Tax=Actinopolymorpha alba TaxID=533267 RepID=UPI0003675CCE|nr:SMI1/KNR4 family protein [Actinopolymorpha alba]
MADDLVRHYRGRAIFGPFAPVEAGELVALEAEIGQPLPSDYRALLEVANGGTLQYSIRLPHSAGGEPIGFDDIYHVGRDQHGEYGYSTLLGEYRRRRECWWAETVSTDNLLPIARDGGGDILYLDLGTQAPGQLVAFVHGLPEWTGLTQHDVFTVVAPSIDSYLDALFIEEGIAQLTWEDVEDTSPSDRWRRVVEDWLDAGLTDWRTRPWAATQ